MKTYIFHDTWGEHEVYLRVRKYAENGNLAVIMLENDDGMWRPYCRLTVNLSEKLPANEAYIDINNVPSAMQFIRENNLGNYTGIWKPSGYCAYPKIRFNMKNLGD